MLTPYLQTLAEKKELSATQCETIIDLLFNETAAPTQIAALLSLLHAKEETANELSAFIKAIKKYAIPLAYSKPVLDIVGTGGDGANTVNISTIASLVVASLGVTVAKHGNQSVSSRCGAKNILDEFNIPTQNSPEKIKLLLNTYHFAFLYAGDYHPIFKKINGIRQSMGIKTIFNLMGPLLNPLTPSSLLLGVANKKHLTLLADCIIQLNIPRAMVIYGNGLDELNGIGPNEAIEIKNQEKINITLHAENFGLSSIQLADIQGGNPSLNKNLLLLALQGKHKAIAETLAFNAGVALYLANRTTTITNGINLALSQITSRKTLTFIEALKNA